jgi:hypothetical protein
MSSCRNTVNAVVGSLECDYRADENFFMARSLRAPIEVKSHHSSGSLGLVETGVSMRSTAVVCAMSGMAHERLTGDWRRKAAGAICLRRTDGAMNGSWDGARIWIISGSILAGTVVVALLVNRLIFLLAARVSRRRGNSGQHLFV